MLPEDPLSELPDPIDTDPVATDDDPVANEIRPCSSSPCVEDAVTSRLAPLLILIDPPDLRPKLPGANPSPAAIATSPAVPLDDAPDEILMLPVDASLLSVVIRIFPDG
jgi:hypothetical protein